MTLLKNHKMGCTTSCTFTETNCDSFRMRKQVQPNNNGVKSGTISTGIKPGAISTEEKIIIKRQWKVLSADIKRTGTDVFLEIFKLNPDIKLLFPFRNIDDKELMTNAQFKAHGIRFMQAIGAAVENMDELETAMTEPIVALGKQHIKFQGFQPVYFEIFCDAISTVWRKVLGVRFTPACAEAWKHVLVFIMDNLKQGYQLASIETET